MPTEKYDFRDNTSAFVTTNGRGAEAIDLTGVFTAVCYDENGNKKWEDTFPNTVTTVGKNAILNTHFGSAAVVANRNTWYMGLITSNGYSAIASADTHASHAGWLESGANGGRAPGYSQTTRRQVTFAAASSATKATSNNVVFTINVAGTVKGAFIANNSTKASANASPTLYSAGLFTVGDKTVSSGDTLNVTYSATA